MPLTSSLLSICCFLFIINYNYKCHPFNSIDLNSDCGVYYGAHNPAIPAFHTLILNKYETHMKDSPWILDELMALRNIFRFSHKQIVTFQISIEVKSEKNRDCIIDEIKLLNRISAGRK